MKLKMNNKIGLCDIDIPPFDSIDWEKHKIIYIISIFQWIPKLHLSIKKQVISRVYINLNTFNSKKEAYEEGLKKARELCENYNKKIIKIPHNQPKYRIRGDSEKRKYIKLNYEKTKPVTNKFVVLCPKFEDARLEERENLAISIVTYEPSKKNKLVKRLVCCIQIPLYNFKSDREAYDLTVQFADNLCKGFNNGTIDPLKQKTYVTPKTKDI